MDNRERMIERRIRFWIAQQHSHGRRGAGAARPAPSAGDAAATGTEAQSG